MALTELTELNNKLKEIGVAIRRRTKKSDELTLEQMPKEIEDMSLFATSYIKETKTITITSPQEMEVIDNKYF